MPGIVPQAFFLLLYDPPQLLNLDTLSTLPSITTVKTIPYERMILTVSLPDDWTNQSISIFSSLECQWIHENCDYSWMLVWIIIRPILSPADFPAIAERLPFQRPYVA